jgi:putative SOS response-associated peptidase YedK
MCARFTLRQVEELTQRFQARLFGDELPPPRYNVAPSQPIPIVVADAGERQVRLARWGLVPSWAKEPSIGQRLINARAETLAEKPSFRPALQRRRCLIPMDGFYEWQAMAGAGGKARKQPFYFHRPDNGLFAVAGLYEYWRAPEGQQLTSCSLITTTPNSLVAPLHDRMPAILLPEHEADWLAEALPENWPALLTSYPADRLTVRPVGSAVNRAGAEGVELIEPLAAPAG